MHYPKFFQHPESGTSLRLHVVGGFTSPNDWIHLGYCAAHWADGSVYISPNSAIELRGITDKAQLAAELDKLELQSFHIPVLASPLSAAAKQAARQLTTHLNTEQPGLESLAITTDADDLPASAAQVSMQLLDDATLNITQSPATNSPTAGLSLADAATHLQRLGALRTEARSTEAKGTEAKATGAAGAELAAEPGPIGWLDEHQAEGVVNLGAGSTKAPSRRSSRSSSASSRWPSRSPRGEVSSFTTSQRAMPRSSSACSPRAVSSSTSIRPCCGRARPANAACAATRAGAPTA